MYARVKELLTPEERLRYTQIPPDLGEWELGTYFTLTQQIGKASEYLNWRNCCVARSTLK